jgi:hypothetical protein
LLGRDLLLRLLDSRAPPRVALVLEVALVGLLVARVLALQVQQRAVARDVEGDVLVARRRHGLELALQEVEDDEVVRRARVVGRHDAAGRRKGRAVAAAAAAAARRRVSAVRGERARKP